ncbi:hypothetical protein O3G_MSEX013978 [Manduca sexta]|uniref:Uncharacterized protein n=1 Tax=Manduca sexta TaxID=7130 RepID=A0A922CYS4_MANSE|nr:hypothetical protein O3G_MSEX013978 [Manduca sexta]
MKSEMITTDELIGRTVQINRIFILITTIIILIFLQETMQEDGQSPVPPPEPTDPSHLTSPRSGNRYTKPTTTQKRQKRTTPPRMSFAEDCDYLAYYCMKAYK